jgi:hypothetical protein
MMEVMSDLPEKFRTKVKSLRPPLENFRVEPSEAIHSDLILPLIPKYFDVIYQRNLNGGIMEAFGIIVTRDIKIYLYPYKPNDKVELQDSNNIAVHPRIKPIYNYLFSNGRIEDLDYDPKVLHIFSRKVLELIKSCDDGKWEDMVPEGVAEIIKEKSLFGSKCEYNPEKN